MSQLSYKQLQGKLKAFKEQGYQLNVKLNAKQEALQLEWERIIAALEAQAQEALTPSATEEVEAHQENSNAFPFCANEVKVENKVEVREQYIRACLPAMTAAAPSWLKQQHQVFYIDNGCGYKQDYLLWEVDLWLQQHQGEYCELPVATDEGEGLGAQVSEAPSLVVEAQGWHDHQEQELTPSITGLLGLLVAVLLLLGLSICSKPWLGLKALALATGEPTCTQAAQNAEWLARCALAFIQGFLRL